MPLPRPGATTTLHGASYRAGGENCALSRPAGTLSRERARGKPPSPSGETNTAPEAATAKRARGKQPALEARQHPRRQAKKKKEHSNGLSSASLPSTVTQRIVIVSGMSGSGKSTAISALEDMGYFCMDNLPSPLLPSAVLLAQQAKETRPLAFVVDVREGPFLERAPEVFENLCASGMELDILFLDSSDEVLLRRYSETRRKHPLAMDLQLHEGISREREKLSWLRNRATRHVDTSSFTVHELKATLRRMFQGAATSSFVLNFMSFGFRFGLPPQADLVFDVRFLKNPHFVPELRPLTGRDALVSDYVFDNEEAKTYFQLLKNFLAYMLPKYANEGKSYVTVCIGCTGGKHRSVAIAQALFYAFKNGPWTAHLWDRDISHNELQVTPP